MRCLNCIAIIFGILCSGQMAWASHAKYFANISSKFIPEKKSVKVSVIAAPNTHLNLEAPWKFTVVKKFLSDGTFEKNDQYAELQASDFDKVENSFFVPLSDVDGNVKTSAGKSPLSFQLVYFICDTQKTWCKRFVHQQK